jgi:hypothetical protein
MSETEKSIAGAVAQLAGSVYADVAQPSARRVGQTLDNLLKLGLSPLDIVNWGYEKSKQWLQDRVAERLSQMPPDSAISPDERVAIPALLGIASSGNEPAIRDLYAELLLKAMDRTTAHQVHPAYVSTLGQLAPEEALAFVGLRDRMDQNLFQDHESSRQFTEGPRIDEQFNAYCSSIGLHDLDQSTIWLENLRRLGLLWTERLSDVKYHETDGGLGARSVSKEEYRNLRFTEFGRRFLTACAPPGTSTNAP